MTKKKSEQTEQEEQQLDDFQEDIKNQRPMQGVVREQLTDLISRVDQMERTQAILVNRVFKLECGEAKRIEELPPAPVPEPVEVKKPLPAKKEVKLPAWQRQEPEPVKEEPKKKLSTKQIVILGIIFIVLIFMLGNCQAIMSYFR